MLSLTQEQPGQSPGSEQGATHGAAARLRVWGVPAFLWVSLGGMGHCWQLVQVLWAVGCAGDQLCAAEAMEQCSHTDTMAPVSKQEQS